jgi:hypothetical protein
MDEKQAPMPPTIRRGLSPLRLVVCMGYLALVGLTYWHFNARATLLQPDPLNLQEAPTVATVRGLVPLEAHIMSKCPDAKDCLRQLVLPAMQKAHNKVNFTLSFIGRPTDQNDGVDCMHGPAECMSWSRSQPLTSTNGP